jgi:hypothetical protein
MQYVYLTYRTKRIAAAATETTTMVMITKRMVDFSTQKHQMMLKD